MWTRVGEQKPPVGVRVRVLRGAYAGYVGIVEDVDEVARTIRILVPFFGRNVPVVLPFDDVQTP